MTRGFAMLVREPSLVYCIVLPTTLPRLFTVEDQAQRYPTDANSLREARTASRVWPHSRRRLPDGALDDLTPRPTRIGELGRGRNGLHFGVAHLVRTVRARCPQRPGWAHGDRQPPARLAAIGTRTGVARVLYPAAFAFHRNRRLLSWRNDSLSGVNRPLSLS
jgi:hypothetical protein